MLMECTDGKKTPLVLMSVDFARVMIHVVDMLVAVDMKTVASALVLTVAGMTAAAATAAYDEVASELGIHQGLQVAYCMDLCWMAAWCGYQNQQQVLVLGGNCSLVHQTAVADKMECSDCAVAAAVGEQ